MRALPAAAAWAAARTGRTGRHPPAPTRCPPPSRPPPRRPVCRAGALPAVSSLESGAAAREAVLSFSIKRREDAFAREDAGARRGAAGAARRRAEAILASGPFAMELDERELEL